MSIGAAQMNSPIGITKMLQNWSLVIKARQSAQAPALVKRRPQSGGGRAADGAHGFLRLEVLRR
jgi:hypothetical protein